MIPYCEVIKRMYPDKGFCITNDDPSTAIFDDGTTPPTLEEITAWMEENQVS